MGGEALQRLSNGLIFAAIHKGEKISEGTFILKETKPRMTGTSFYVSEVQAWLAALLCKMTPRVGSSCTTTGTQPS